MKKVVFLFAFFLLTVANNRLSVADPRPEVQKTVVMQETCGGPEMPIGEGEEQSGTEEDKSISEDDDDAGINHRLLSRGKSASTDLNLMFQEKLFKALEREVVIPPPRA